MVYYLHADMPGMGKQDYTTTKSYTNSFILTLGQNLDFPLNIVFLMHDNDANKILPIK